MTIKFEDWEAERMKDPEFRAAVEELGTDYQKARADVAAAMSNCYWLTGVQPRMISDVVRQAKLPIYEVFEACDLLKQIEYDQLIEEDEEQPCTIVAILSGIWTELDSLNTLVGAMVVLNFIAVIAAIILGAIVVGSLWQ